MKDTVYITQKVHNTASSSYVFLADILDFRPGDMVKLTFHKKGDENRFMQSLIKRVVKIGNSQGCYIGKSYGVEKGDILVIRVDDANDNTGIETEKGSEESLE